MNGPAREHKNVLDVDVQNVSTCRSGCSIYDVIYLRAMKCYSSLEIRPFFLILLHHITS